MNNTLQELKNRKSVRVFLDRPLGDEVRKAILDAALEAPTAGNQCLYSIIDVQDPALKIQLADCCDQQDFIAEAGLVLVFLADCRRWLDIYRAAGLCVREPGVGDLFIACEDAIIAAQNTVVAAESLSVGSCYIGDVLEYKERLSALLHLKDYLFPACMVVFGWPTQQQTERKKPNRFNKGYIIQTDRYRPLEEKELREMFAERHPEDTFDFNRYIKAFCERKYMSEFSIEMTRSAAEYLKQYEPYKSK